MVLNASVPVTLYSIHGDILFALEMHCALIIIHSGKGKGFMLLNTVLLFPQFSFEKLSAELQASGAAAGKVAGEKKAFKSVFEHPLYVRSLAHLLGSAGDLALWCNYHPNYLQLIPNTLF